MNGAQLHVMVVHLPVVGILSAAVLLLLARGDRQPPLRRAGYLFLVLSAVFSVVAYYSGPPALEVLQASRGLTESEIEDHALVGRAVFLSMAVAGMVALMTLLREFQGDPPARWHRGLLLLATLLLCWLAAWCAHLGGAVSHPESRELSLPLFPALGR